MRPLRRLRTDSVTLPTAGIGKQRRSPEDLALMGAEGWVRPTWFWVLSTRKNGLAYRNKTRLYNTFPYPTDQPSQTKNLYFIQWVGYIPHKANVGNQCTLKEFLSTLIPTKRNPVAKKQTPMTNTLFPGTGKISIGPFRD